MAANTGYSRVVESEETEYANGYHDETPEETDSLDDIPESVLSEAQLKRQWWRNAIINMFFIAAWFILAIVLSVYNKWMFSKDKYGFTWPIFVTMLHMVVQFGFAALARTLFPETFRPPFNPTRSDYGKKVVPTAVATGMDVGLSNLSLKIITLSFYTMCKSSSLIFVLLFALLFGLEKFSLRLVGVIILIVIGVLMMVARDTEVSILGFILVTSASALGGLRWSLTHLLLKDRRMGMDNPAATIFWLAPVMAVTLGIASLVLESWKAIFTSKFFDSTSSFFSTALFLAIPGTMAFFMVITEYTIIQRAGVIPMSIAGIAKEVTQISVAAWLFGDELTPVNIVGVGVTVCGIALFTYHKYQKSIHPRDAVITSRDAHSELGLREDMDVELDEREPLAASHAQTIALFDHNNKSDEPLVNGVSSIDVVFDAGNDGAGGKDTMAVSEERRPGVTVRGNGQEAAMSRFTAASGSGTPSKRT